MENKQNKIQDEEVEMIDTSSRPNNNTRFHGSTNVNQNFMADERLDQVRLSDQLNGYGYGYELNEVENQWEAENPENYHLDRQRLDNVPPRTINETFINPNHQNVGQLQLIDSFLIPSDDVANENSHQDPMVLNQLDQIIQKKTNNIQDYKNDLDCCRAMFQNMLFSSIDYDEMITPNTILEYDFQELNNKLDATIDQQSHQALKDKIKEIKVAVRKEYNALKRNLMKAASENNRFDIGPGSGLSVSEINPLLDSIQIPYYPLIHTINQIKGPVFKPMSFIKKLENNNERLIMFHIFKNNIHYKHLNISNIKQLEDDWEIKKTIENPLNDDKLHINSTINNQFVEENFKWQNFCFLPFFKSVGANRTLEKSLELLFVPNEATIIMASVRQYDNQLITVINDFFEKQAKEIFFFLNFSKNVLNRISPEFHMYFSILNRIYSNPLLYKMFFTVLKLSEIEQTRKAFNWTKSYGEFFPKEGDIKDIIDPRLKFGMSNPMTTKFQQDKALLETIFDSKNNFKTFINGEGVAFDFFQGPFRKKDLFDLMGSFLMQVTGHDKLLLQMGFFENFFSGQYSIYSPNSDDLFQNIQFRLPKVDDTSKKDPSHFKKFLQESKNSHEKLKIVKIIHYLMEENKYIKDNFFDYVSTFARDLGRGKAKPCQKSEESASYFNDFLKLMEKKYYKSRDKINHLMKAKLSARSGVVYVNPEDEIILGKVIKFLDICNLNPVLAFICFLSSRGIKLDMKEMPKLFNIKTFYRTISEHTNRNSGTLYNFLEEQAVAQGQPTHFGSIINFLMLFVLRPQWLEKQEELLKHYDYLHSQEFEFFNFESMKSSKYTCRYFINEEDRKKHEKEPKTDSNDFHNKSLENINLLKLLWTMGFYFTHRGVDDSVLSINPSLDEKVYETSVMDVEYFRIDLDNKREIHQDKAGLINGKMSNYDFQTSNSLDKCVQDYANNFSLINSNPLMFTVGFTNVLLNHHMDLFIKLLHYSFQRNNEGIGCFKEYFEKSGDHFNLCNIEVKNQIKNLSIFIAHILNHCLVVDYRHFPQWAELINFNTFFSDELEQEEFNKYYSKDGESKKAFCVIMYLLSYFQEKHQLNYLNKTRSMIGMSNYQKKSISPLLEPWFYSVCNFFMLKSILKELKFLEPQKPSSSYKSKVRIDLNNLSLKEKDPHCKHFMDKAIDYKNKQLTHLPLDYKFFRHVLIHNPRLNHKLMFVFLWERKKGFTKRSSGASLIANKYLWTEIFQYTDIIPKNYLNFPEKLEFVGRMTKMVDFYYKKFKRK
jgi:hypothetical protein